MQCSYFSFLYIFLTLLPSTFSFLSFYILSLWFSSDVYYNFFIFQYVMFLFLLPQRLNSSFHNVSLYLPALSLFPHISLHISFLPSPPFPHAFICPHISRLHVPPDSFCLHLAFVFIASLFMSPLTLIFPFFPSSFPRTLPLSSYPFIVSRVPSLLSPPSPPRPISLSLHSVLSYPSSYSPFYPPSLSCLSLIPPYTLPYLPLLTRSQSLMFELASSSLLYFCHKSQKVVESLN